MMDETLPLIKTDSNTIFNSFFATANSFQTPLRAEKNMGTFMFIVNVFNGTLGIGLIMLLDIFVECKLILSSLTFFFVFINIVLSTLYIFDSMARTSGAALALEMGGFPKNEVGQIMFDFPRMLSFYLYGKGRILSFFVSLSYLLFALWCSLSFCYNSLDKIIKSFGFKESFNCSIVSLIIGAPTSTEVCLGYYGLTIGFLILFVVLSVVNPKLFKRLQLVFFLYRILALVLMYTTLIIFFIGSNNSNIANTSSASDDEDWWWPLCRYGSMLSVSFFSLINCNTVIESTTQSYTKHPLRYTLIVDLICFLIYFILSLMNLFFTYKTGIMKDIWMAYTGLGSGWEQETATQKSTVWAMVIRVLIMLLPLITTISIYPSMVAFAAQSIYRFFNIQTFIIYHMWLDILIRAGVSIIPILLCVVYNDAKKILSIVGMSATVIGGMIPSLIQFVSVKHVQKVFGVGMHVTKYFIKYLSSAFIAKVLFVLGAIDICFEMIHFVTCFFVSD
ncbi:hypothetical protein EIN_398060 [Entamoeba invadens IP1]|uniref:Amino acid transporter transmembrane domain-containing protein n=1 Tax=Entamoeba invadens IP1 TaxID=370355 RepID=A0A0A1UDI7_ENTIV|nr:hypothetical protein EIN_398060 [Entamoeba invadens IP1]ELP91876.1 hypothetical protein EIN_398060 [Entamoeba invadens IP1]|eukprot:XP_004258647.1 hypothetical protein EIN_398060 [Entamoeba invadens IP1]